MRRNTNGVWFGQSASGLVRRCFLLFLESSASYVFNWKQLICVTFRGVNLEIGTIISFFAFLCSKASAAAPFSTESHQKYKLLASP